MQPVAGGDMLHTDAHALHNRIANGENAQVLDVREPWEHKEGVIAGALLMPLAQVRTRWGDLDPARPVTVICHLGSRSAIAARFLTQKGLIAENVDDGMAAWQAQGFPIVR
jgi:rhodanese-related sulfurtransferase